MPTTMPSRGPPLAVSDLSVLPASFLYSLPPDTCSCQVRFPGHSSGPVTPSQTHPRTWSTSAFPGRPGPHEPTQPALYLQVPPPTANISHVPSSVPSPSYALLHNLELVTCREEANAVIPNMQIRNKEHTWSGTKTLCISEKLQTLYFVIVNSQQDSLVCCLLIWQANSPMSQLKPSVVRGQHSPHISTRFHAGLRKPGIVPLACLCCPLVLTSKIKQTARVVPNSSKFPHNLSKQHSVSVWFPYRENPS